MLSTIHIKQLIDMAPRELWTQDFVDGVETWQAECQMMATNYATTEPPKYPIGAGKTISPVHSGMLASSGPRASLRLRFRQRKPEPGERADSRDLLQHGRS